MRRKRYRRKKSYISSDKKKLPSVFLTSLTALLLIVVSIGAISAYFVTTDEEVNDFYVDKNEITVEEEFDKPEKGKKTVKKPVALNTGSADCYVRAMVVVSDSRAAEYFKYYNNNTAGFNTSDWTSDSDGWMYYKYTLESGERTSPVFTHIQVLDSMPDAFMDFTIDVVFESVQSENYSSAKTAFASLAKGG